MAAIYPKAPRNTPTGWADDRLMQAYDLIWETMKAHEAKGIASEFAALLRAVEAADKTLFETAHA